MHCHFNIQVMKKLTAPGKISIVLIMACIAMLWFKPMWRIDLRAPQYPEGISMQIWIDDVKGDVAIINGLNHYIGMKTIHKKDFVEFLILPKAFLIFISLGVVVLFCNRKLIFYLWSGLFLLISLFAFSDFYMWEYNYGHNLDPHAPIQVPGMVYQPPLLGYKKMLNFEALSQPDVGGWFFIGAGVLLLTASVYEWKKNKNDIRLHASATASVGVLHESV